MFLAGAFSQLGESAANNGDVSKASSYGAAAASFVIIFTSVFGATVRNYESSISRCSKYSHSPYASCTCILPKHPPKRADVILQGAISNS
jgi:hypothetical protein